MVAGCPWQTVGITKKSPSKAGGLLNPRSGVLSSKHILTRLLQAFSPPLRSVDYCFAIFKSSSLRKVDSSETELTQKRFGLGVRVVQGHISFAGK